MTDEELVAEELARLDAIANQPEPSDQGLHAHIRAYALRKVPADVAAAILREEAMRALWSGPRKVAATPTGAVWQMELIARGTGIRGWSALPMAAEVRARVEAYKRQHPKPKARRARTAPVPVIS